MHNIEMWIKGLVAAAIAGGANGVITGFAAVGIAPDHFNLQAGLRPTLAIAGISALMSALIGAAAYLKQSPLPDEDDVPRDGNGAPPQSKWKQHSRGKPRAASARRGGQQGENSCRS